MKIKKILTFVLVALAMSAIAVFGLSCGTGNGSSDSTPEGSAQEAKVVFDTNTDLETNVVRERSIVIGRRVSEPKLFITGDNPDNLHVYGWYTSEDCTEDTRWDFKKGRVAGDMTLYAKWVELYDVNYVINGELHSTVNVFNGDYIEETAEIVMGYKYLGSFADEEHTVKFDFSTPIKGDTNIYVQRSEGLYLSDYEEEGLLSAGNLTDYLTSGCGSYNPDEGTEEGWVEPYTIESTGEKCTYVNFGLNPVWGDGYVELSLMLDISQSQIIRLTFKNIGSATKINCYFTAMLDMEGNYSETGSFYTPNFNWPNYIGGPVGDALPIPSRMSEDDEWITVDFNLYEVYRNGYSIWGTSPYLGAIRIDANYKNADSEDWSNEMLIKSIEGIPHEVIVEDSYEAKEVLGYAMSTTEGEVIEAGELLAENERGIDFVKDYKSLGATKGNIEVFPTTNGILMYAENEILARENNGQEKSFVMNLPEGREVSFETLTTLNITLQNYGYQDQLMVYVYNEQGVPVRTTLDINTRMFEPSTYSVNLYGLFGITREEDEDEEHRFVKIEFVYTSRGVDNMILFKDVTFSEFIPLDTVGINFNDKFTYGIESNADVDVAFNSKDRGTDFNVKRSGAVVTSPEKSYNATNVGYSYMSLKGKLPEGSNITAVKAELMVNGVFGTPYVYEITEAGSLDIKLPLVKEERGFVKAVRLTFEGTGLITIKELAYSVNETSLPYYGSYDLVYNSGHTDWKGEGNIYEYNSKEDYSTFVKNPVNSYLGFSIYIGFSSYESYLQTPHKTHNVLITGKTVVTLVYQNRTETADIGMHLGFTNTDKASSDEGMYPVLQTHAIPIDANMGAYEWSAVSVVIDGATLQTYLDTYLGKISFEFWGEQISIRAISIEVEA
ncbi:MAG: InlB B-repeat-containing protein [Clostridia bacterium]|nr:InlB B-repeat-containing protein [Clostridia bacterium]